MGSKEATKAVLTERQGILCTSKLPTTIGLLSDSAVAMQTEADVVRWAWYGPNCLSLIFLLSHQSFDNTIQTIAPVAIDSLVDIP